MDARTSEIISRFHESWDQTERWYTQLAVNFELVHPILGFLRRLRVEGASERFRIGTSMYTLIFSRSVEFGLRPDQKSVSIEALAVGDFEVIMREGPKRYREYRVTDLSDVRVQRLLKTLEDTLID